MLRFSGYFTEAVPDSPLEAWRARRVTVLHFLEDDTMAVSEPPEPNSGIMQVGAGGQVLLSVGLWALHGLLAPACSLSLIHGSCCITGSYILGRA